MGGQALRQLVDGRSALLPGIWDALSGRLVRQAGFPAAFVSGYAVSGSLLGLPDFGYLTQTEMAEVARRIHAANPDLMMVVDADTGYGNPLNTVRTIELWQAAGADGIFLEDQVWPKRCGHMVGKQVIETDDWLAKLRAAVRTAQRSTDAMYVTARTDARAAVNLQEAIERGKKARDVGVDAVFVEAPESIDEYEQIASALPDVTLVANMVETGRSPLLTPTELHELGFSFVISPLSVLFSMVQAATVALDHLQTHGTLRDRLDTLVDFATFGRIVDLDAHYAAEQEYRA